ncbi:CDKN2A-interacting protein-like [Scleropages formosus]|uniref:CDKN2A-interacting protein-like n=1 Tax=Scleropages formosus TaxID=113540 RepID=A0A0P7V674_SCLFO|nr:CDKN2A-interacting protein-like [Scleropages formosus]
MYRCFMAERRGEDVVSEFLKQNPHLAQWVESLRGQCETNKQWRGRKEFILRNLESFPTVLPDVSSPSLDRLLSLSMVWANHVFLGCIYPQSVMNKVNEMAEGIVVDEIQVRKTRDEIMGKGKRTATSDKEMDNSIKKLKAGNTEVESKAGGRAAVRSGGSGTFKCGPPPQAPTEHQPFFNRLYKAVAWKLVSAGGFGPNLDHFEILRACIESSKASLSCVFVPLKDIPDLPAGRAQKEGQVCELRCQTVYMGTGYGRDEDSARAMASKEALKIFQSRKVTVKICRRRFRGKDVEDLVLVDDQLRNSGFPPALAYPFQADQQPSPS